MPTLPGKAVRLSTVWLLLVTISLLAAADKPVVIAHRGGAALRPENTIAAFQHALQLGVAVLEFDMNMTADGEIVIHHDSTVNASVCSPPVTPARIALLKLSDLKRLDCGSFQRPNSPGFRSAPGQRMATLDEFLTAVKGSRAVLLGETKMDPAVDPGQFVDKIDAAVKRHGLEGRFILQSGDYRTIDAMRRKSRTVGRCLLNTRRFKPDYLKVAREHGATHLMLRTDDVTAEQMKALHASGLKVYSSTANSESDWKKYTELGMDGILTDDPEGLIRFLAR